MTKLLGTVLGVALLVGVTNQLLPKVGAEKKKWQNKNFMKMSPLERKLLNKAKLK